MKNLKTFETFSEPLKTLRDAILANDFRAVQELLDSGADISERNYMAVKIAAEQGNVRILDLLLAHMDEVADMNTQMRVRDAAKKFVSVSNLSERDKQTIYSRLD